VKHWIRDLPITFATATRGQGQMDYVVFHFLRTAGWEWIWECDGYAGDDPNRVPDGNMEAAGVASYTALGSAVLSKVTTPLRSGTQALHVASSASNDGVETSLLTSMETSTEYHVAIWARNDSGNAWDVDVDPGTGYANVGTIPDNGGVWTLYHFSFTSAALGAQKLRIVDSNSTLDEIHVSDILIFRSLFEYNPADAWEGGSGGIITNPDQFSAPSYNFAAGDIGKVVCIWDTTNLGNSGAYAITSVAAGVATLDLRSGSAALTTQAGLSWRMIDLAAAPENAAGGNTAERGAGFGLQSPHSSGHRMFLRQSQHGPTSPNIDAAAIWGAPEDTDFDFSTGTFYLTGPSSQNTRQAPYTRLTVNTGPWADTHVFVSGDESAGSRRFFLMTDDDGSFMTMFAWDSDNSDHECLVIGYLGVDVQHPGVEEWGLFSRWEIVYPSNWVSSVDFDANTYRFAYAGTVIGPDGQAVRAGWAQYGYSTSVGTEPITQSNAGPNRWSGNEWLHRPLIARDLWGTDQAPSERDGDFGVYQGRQNMVDLSTFDSDSFFHIINGLVWEWPGVTVLP
jgi:hypothetical protein